MSSQQLNDALRSIQPGVLVYIQNKVEAYATALVDQRLEYDPDPAKQVKLIVGQAEQRAIIFAYEQLLAEIIAAQTEFPSEDNSETQT